MGFHRLNEMAPYWVGQRVSEVSAGFAERKGERRGRQVEPLRRSRRRGDILMSVDFTI
jgi:hypothetical protein